VHDTVCASHELEQGHLRIAADGPHIVMGLLVRFIATYPKVRLSVAMGNTGFVRRRLLEGHADVTILPGISRHRRVDAIHLWRHTLVVVVTNDHPCARRRSIDVEELKGQPLLAREEGSTTQRLLRATLHAANIRPNFILAFGRREATSEAATAGIGIGLIWELETRGSTRFTMLPIRNANIYSSDFITCLKSERSRKVVKSFFSVSSTFAASTPQPMSGRTRRPSHF